jgi:hypothetical protein
MSPEGKWMTISIVLSICTLWMLTMLARTWKAAGSYETMHREVGGLRVAVIESMTRIHLPHHTIRVWRDEATSGYNNEDLLETADAEWLVGRSPGQVFVALLVMARVSAVEMVDERGNGSVVYTNWP